MDIFFSPYELTPIKRANRLSSLDKKVGIYLKAKINGVNAYADFFPHIPLGDCSVDEFLTQFQNQKNEYDRKILDLLLKDPHYQKQEVQTFRNHQLWNGSDPIESKIIKYKLMSSKDRAFLEAMNRKVRVRLDGNGIFSRNSFEIFLSKIPQDLHGLIDYIEDPLHEPDWSNLCVPTARDFITSNTCDYYIYKPNCEFLPQIDAKIVFSAYLGSDLGTWHTYCEMMKDGDLSVIQGIVGKGFYQEERGLFQGNCAEGFTPDKNVVKNIYQELELRNWKLLCKI